MKRIAIVLILVFVFASLQFGIEEITPTNRINFEEKMAKNEVFFKDCAAFDLDPATDRVYFLDKSYGHILVVKLSSGELIKSISSKGQGPAELHNPTSMRVRDGKIYVLDRGFGGIKMFDTEGKSSGQFRLRALTSHWARIDANSNGEIFVGDLNRNDKMMVTVYDPKGTVLRTLIKYKGEDVAKAFTRKSRTQFYLRLDNEGNIILVFYMLRQVEKYDPKGNLLWAGKLKNRLLEDYPAELDKYIDDGRIYQSTKHVFDVDVNEANEIIVGHAGGGSVFSPDGKITQSLVITTPYNEKTINVGLLLFRVRNGKLMNYIPFAIDQYDLK
ncbi:MAG: hypothetical protein GY765_27470 [bacterium]|nr:hypothetical protein [bacterium]